jgi:hypothetical protein
LCNIQSTRLPQAALAIPERSKPLAGAKRQRQLRTIMSDYAGSVPDFLLVFILMIDFRVTLQSSTRPYLSDLANIEMYFGAGKQQSFEFNKKIDRQINRDVISSTIAMKLNGQSGCIGTQDLLGCGQLINS